jgi:hypothetical protein
MTGQATQRRIKMKSRWTIGVAGGLVVALGLLIFGRSQDAQGQKEHQAPKWEYKVVMLATTPGDRGTTEEQFTGQMNKLGAEGWEFAGVVFPGSQRQAYPTVVYKRPKR